MLLVSQLLEFVGQLCSRSAGLSLLRTQRMHNSFETG